MIKSDQNVRLRVKKMQGKYTCTFLFKLVYEKQLKNDECAI